MIGPYPLADVITRLSDPGSPLRHVGNAADLQTALTQQPRALPAAFVVRQERAEPSRGASGGVLVQRMAVDVIVVLYVRNVAQSESGAAALSDMTALATYVRSKLLNWASDPAVFEPLAMNASRDQAYAGGLLVSQELFRSAYRIEVH